MAVEVKILVVIDYRSRYPFVSTVVLKIFIIINDFRLKNKFNSKFVN